jgi:catechol 2,3-dioxygenase-like lactoylglutathione lyase family enzyme
MSKNGLNGLSNVQDPSWQVHHVGVVVEDMGQALRFYEALGGKFGDVHLPTVEREYRGQPASNIRMHIKMGHLGNTGMELIQPVEGQSAQMEFLHRCGGGLHHICFSVADLKQEVLRLEKQGFVLIYRARFEPSGGVAYLEGAPGEGFVVELAQWPPGMRAL